MVDDGWLALMAEASSGVKFSKFSDYVLDTYVGDKAKFPPELWSRAPHSDPRTTNSAEGFHRHFNSQFTGSHPNEDGD
ncbi:uncharacterized protein LOC127750289 [Frankliniella occidentalis]|uniref:Uncharacterized protein LOC127750289 n=1 Tax=Frankliniella occidentalis TaxID=133901 RepID=A0A9C6X1N0_FRAOC|nr:uncharacterized protein LOC127750289 [Frankliniella occidentalis]